MAAKKKVPRFSAAISAFCQMMEDARRDYDWNNDEVGRLDRLTQDYLHQLELGGYDYQQRAKVATKLAECRKLRRISKDTVEVLEPFITFLDSDKGKSMLNLTREALGKTRKVEERMETRTYRYRVIDAPNLTGSVGSNFE